MKRILNLALVAVAILVVSCGKKDDDSVSSKDLVGTWSLESIVQDGEKAVLDDCNKKSEIVFTDKEYSLKLYEVNGRTSKCELAISEVGTYTVSGNDFVVKPNGEDISSVKISLSGNKLTLSETGKKPDGKSYTSNIVFVKK